MSTALPTPESPDEFDISMSDCLPESVESCSTGLTLRTLHWTMLGLATLVLVMAASLRVRNDQRVEFFFAPGHPLPEACSAKRTLGLDCPGCGLTRSFVYLMQGDLAASRKVHTFGWLMFLVVLVQYPYRYWALRDPRQPPFGHLLPWTPIMGIVLLLWADWIVRQMSLTQ
ncbi:MAG: DUF2752 domain-containing protein [Planctomycetaceae bacterium]